MALLKAAAGHLEGHGARGAGRPEGLPAGRIGRAAGVGRASAAARGSVVRAARYGLPLMLAIIGGNPRRFAPYVELYRERCGDEQPALPIGVHSPGHVAVTDEQAREELWPHYAAMMTRIGRERGWPPDRPRAFRAGGRPRRRALRRRRPRPWPTKIAQTVQSLGLSRFDLKYSNGTLPHDKLMTSIELYGTKVVPRVRELLARAA